MSDEGTARFCLVPKAGIRQAEQPRAVGELMGGWREQDPCVLHLILDLLGRRVCGLSRGLVLWLLAHSLHGC